MPRNNKKSYKNAELLQSLGVAPVSNRHARGLVAVAQAIVPSEYPAFGRETSPLLLRCIRSFTNTIQIGISSDGTTDTTSGTPTYVALNALPSGAYGVSQWSAFYRRYRVNQAIVEITSICPSGTGMSIQGVALPNDTFDTASYPGAYTLSEKPGYIVKHMQAGGPCGIVHRRFVLDGYKMCGISKLEYESNTETYAALLGAVPAIGAANLVLNTAGVNTTSLLIVYNVRITYVVELFERIVLT